MRSWWPFALVLAGCGDGCGGSDLMTREELLDPETCADCHPDHVAQWRGSMHAYAADDPVFLALEARGQAETGGELGDFCVNCHAPLAVALGEASTGADLADLPDHLKGVTCAFCHQVTDVEGTHNNPLVLADDLTLRGPIRDPLDPGVHVPEYSKLHDREQIESADLCGSCHDIVTPLGAHIERTYLEWQTSLYALPAAGFGLTCSGCHMQGRDDVAADFDGVPLRRVHDHRFPGVDIALTEFPDREAQREAVQRLLDSTVRTALCVTDVGDGDKQVQLTLENVAAGHAFPSGASADRRLWAELVARQGGAVVWEKGVVGEDQPLTEVTAADPTVFALHDTLYDLDGNPTHFFWEAADTDGNLLSPPGPPGGTPYAHHQTRQWLILDQAPDEVSLELKLRPLPLDLLDELVATGELAQEVRDAVPTWTLAGASLTWRAGGPDCVP